MRWLTRRLAIRTYNADELFATRRPAEAEGHRVTRAQFERDIAAKANDQAFLADVQPMLAPGVVYDPLVALDMVRAEFVTRLLGAPWKGK